MASIIPGYEYDIFISYRHNDNLSGWVKQFVEALQEELSATLKEPFSIYFDINPHDGLLETHSVDKSLEGKLKCLIFIPVISQTYCDPQSYAWQHEFCTYNKLAKEDKFGRDIRLVSGNIASRILPIKIHDLDPEDSALLENELGGLLRAVEFIFKSPGVNRPLTHLDNPDKNQNQTLYRDQVNKVANAIKDILKGIKNMEIQPRENITSDYLISQIRSLPFRKKIKKRSIVRASLVYILSSLVFWKIMVINSSLVNLSWNTIQLISIVLIVLFPFAMLLAWLYERSPQGFIRTDSVASSENSFTDNKKKPFTSYTFISLLLVTTGALFLLFPRTIRTQSSERVTIVEKSVAVLPFINDSQDQGNMYFINGIMDEILNNLQAIKGLRVISRTSVEQFRGTVKPTLPEIARKLGVNYIVEGSGQKYGNTFRIVVELIAAKNERHLWGNSFEKEIKETKDILSIQSQIAQSIATELKTIITPEEKQLIERTPTTNLTAYDFYQRGRDEHITFWLDKSKIVALKKAEYCYRKALEYDSTLAKAYSGLALAYIDKNIFSKTAYLSKNYLDSALILADRALFYDNQLAEAYSARASYYLYTGKSEQASYEANKALEYNPNYWEIYGFTGMMFLNDPYHLDFVKGIESLNKAVGINRGKELPYLLRELGSAYGAFAGLLENANSCNLEALNLDGDSTKYLNFLASKEWLQGNFKGAIENCIKCLKVDTTNIDTYNTLGECYSFLGMPKESYKNYKKYVTKLEASGNLSINRYHRIGCVYWENGFKKEAEHYLDLQKKLCEESIKMNRAYAKTQGVYYDLAGIYAFTGKKVEAYENLREWSRISVCPLWWIIYIKNDPLFASLRNEPEFQQIARDVESKYQAEHERVRKWMEKQGKL